MKVKISGDPLSRAPAAHASALAGTAGDDVTVEIIVHETFLYDTYDAHAPVVLPEADQPTNDQATPPLAGADPA